MMMRLTMMGGALVLALSACVTPMQGQAPAPVDLRGPARTAAPSQDGCAQVVPIFAETTQDGISKENAYLRTRFPGARKTDQYMTYCGSTPVDVVTLVTEDGYTEEVWFDISSFFGKTGSGDLDDRLDG
ncbi:hypothetical protein [Aquisalinus flavus]|nr:hypothetical protein [Aquisalinus flavus]MBD0427024.1 hypothetical protein [Aquisalinus flavus]UNE46850.1 hypothetical protein FF099_01660 [Aquisalinus flavus]